MIQFEQSQYGGLDTSDLKHDALPFAEAFAPMLAQAGYDGDGLVEVLSRSFSYVLFANSRPGGLRIATAAAPTAPSSATCGTAAGKSCSTAIRFSRASCARPWTLKIEENREVRSRLEADLATLRVHVRAGSRPRGARARGDSPIRTAACAP